MFHETAKIYGSGNYEPIKKMTSREIHMSVLFAARDCDSKVGYDNSRLKAIGTWLGVKFESTPGKIKPGKFTEEQLKAADVAIRKASFEGI